MKSRLVLLACCLALLSSCGQGDKKHGKSTRICSDYRNNHRQPDKQLSGYY